MAFGASQAGMSPFKLKAGFIMIEPGWIPVIKSVAGFAICFPIFGKLSVMFIAMAICAAFGKCFELLYGCSVIVFSKMAIATA